MGSDRGVFFGENRVGGDEDQYSYLSAGKREAIIVTAARAPNVDLPAGPKTTQSAATLLRYVGNEYRLLLRISR